MASKQAPDDRTRMTARLQHPHILPLPDSGDPDELQYYVTSFVTEETLRAIPEM